MTIKSLYGTENMAHARVSQWFSGPLKGLGGVLKRLSSDPSSCFGLAVVVILVVCAILAPWIATHDPNPRGPAQCIAVSGCGELVRHRRAWPRHLQPHRLRHPHHPVDHHPRLDRCRAGRSSGGHDRRIFRRLVRHRHDADHRHLSLIPRSDPVTRIRCGTWVRGSKTRSSPLH